MFTSCIKNIFSNKLVVRTIFYNSYKNKLLLNNRSNVVFIIGKNFVDSVNNFKTDSKILATPLKKRPPKKKKVSADGEIDTQSGFWTIRAMSTAEEYNLEKLVDGLINQDLYEPKKIDTSEKSLQDVIRAVPKYEVGHKEKEIYFFREGTIIFWNTPELESENVLKFIKKYEENSYSRSVVKDECEVMSYTYTEPNQKSHLKNGDIYLSTDATALDKYTFSNAISQSVKLGIWEASLDHYIESIEFVTEDLKAGRKIKMSREEVLRKQGELFALRHLINLSSDLLDTPDFYWERDDLENLYLETCNYLSIAKRTRVMNEKINHCVELVELLSSHLSDRHHVRLEWMIIILILVEVCFELLHYLDRYLEKEQTIVYTPIT